MDLYVPQYICLARVAGTGILLDLRKSRYHAAPTPFCEILEAAACGDGAPLIGTPAVDWLISQGLLRLDSLGPVVRPACPTPALIEWSDDSSLSSRVSARILMKSLALQLVSAFWLKFYSLEKILGSLSIAKASHSNKDSITPVDLDAILAASRATHAWIGEADRCLMKSIALYRLLIMKGITAELVIGVRLAPFSAHCWVQKDGAVLNDRIERVRLFTPIVSV